MAVRMLDWSKLPWDSWRHLTARQVAAQVRVHPDTIKRYRRLLGVTKPVTIDWRRLPWHEWKNESCATIAKRLGYETGTVRRWRNELAPDWPRYRRTETLKFLATVDWKAHQHLHNGDLARKLDVPWSLIRQHRPEPYPRSRRGAQHAYDKMILESAIWGTVSRFRPTGFRAIWLAVQEYYPEICDNTVRRQLKRYIAAGRMRFVSDDSDRREWGYQRVK